MMETLNIPEILNKAKEKLSGPLLTPREVDRAIFVGDTHTALDVTQTVFDKYYEDADLIVFLGDYVDRGKTGVENLGLIASRFLEDPHRVVMLRGNHESPLTNPYYGFLDEVNEKFGGMGYEGFKQFFEAMPYAIVVNDHLCLHGGLASGLTKVSEIGGLPRPDENPNDPVAFQLLWNDPREMIEGFVPSVRGDGAFYFGADVTNTFLEDNSLKGLIRGHEVVDGFREDMDGKVITVFSSRYHGSSAGILVMDNDMMEQVRI
ncbi:MAG TPA: metallophosphoesterase [Candidatus Binatus sp.]|nr:metallophosphoesterase [Candidatus Binatus sp.]